MFFISQMNGDFLWVSIEIFIFHSICPDYNFQSLPPTNLHNEFNDIIIFFFILYLLFLLFSYRLFFFSFSFSFGFLFQYLRLIFSVKFWIRGIRSDHWRTVQCSKAIIICAKRFLYQHKAHIIIIITITAVEVVVVVVVVAQAVVAVAALITSSHRVRQAITMNWHKR